MQKHTSLLALIDYAITTPGTHVVVPIYRAHYIRRKIYPHLHKKLSEFSYNDSIGGSIGFIDIPSAKSQIRLAFYPEHLDGTIVDSYYLEPNADPKGKMEVEILRRTRR